MVKLDRTHRGVGVGVGEMVAIGVGWGEIQNCHSTGMIFFSTSKIHKTFFFFFYSLRKKVPHFLSAQQQPPQHQQTAAETSSWQLRAVLKIGRGYLLAREESWS